MKIATSPKNIAWDRVLISYNLPPFLGLNKQFEVEQTLLSHYVMLLPKHNGKNVWISPNCLSKRQEVAKDHGASPEEPLLILSDRSLPYDILHNLLEEGHEVLLFTFERENNPRIRNSRILGSYTNKIKFIWSWVSLKDGALVETPAGYTAQTHYGRTAVSRR